MLAGLLLVRGLSKPQVLATLRKAALRTAEFTRRGLHASMRLVRSTRRLAPRAAAFARHVTPALLMPFLLVSTLLLFGVIVWSLFPPQGAWRIEPGDIAPRAGRSFAWTVPQPALPSVRHRARRRQRRQTVPIGSLPGRQAAGSAACRARADFRHRGRASTRTGMTPVVFASPDNSDPENQWPRLRGRARRSFRRRG
jgi:hypothetical protein